jgi:hypothetical protein
MALNFSDVQKKLCAALLNGPLSLETLAERTQMKHMDIQSEMKSLMQLKLVSLQGTPPLYVLKEEVMQEMKRRKGMEADDDNPFRVKIVIEVQGVEEELVKGQVDKILTNLKNEPFFNVYASTVEKVEKIEEKYSTFAEVNLSVRDFRALVRLMFFYGPASVEVIKPTKIEFTLDDFQNGLVDMTEMVHAYANYIMGILSRKKVEEFNTQFYAGVQKAHSLQPKLQSAPSSLPEDLPTI